MFSLESLTHCSPRPPGCVSDLLAFFRLPHTSVSSESPTTAPGQDWGLILSEKDPPWASLLVLRGRGQLPLLLAKSLLPAIKNPEKTGRPGLPGRGQEDAKEDLGFEAAPGPGAKQNTPPGSIRGEQAWTAFRDLWRL